MTAAELTSAIMGAADRVSQKLEDKPELAHGTPQRKLAELSCLCYMLARIMPDTSYMYNPELNDVVDALTAENYHTAAALVEMVYRPMPR